MRAGDQKPGCNVEWPNSYSDRLNVSCVNARREKLTEKSLDFYDFLICYQKQSLRFSVGLLKSYVTSFAHKRESLGTMLDCTNSFSRLIIVLAWSIIILA